MPTLQVSRPQSDHTVGEEAGDELQHLLHLSLAIILLGALAVGVEEDGWIPGYSLTSTQRVFFGTIHSTNENAGGRQLSGQCTPGWGQIVAMATPNKSSTLR